MFGKSIYIWAISAICGGDPGRIAADLKAAGFESAILHEANLTKWRTPERIGLVKALKTQGIVPIGGAAVYGYGPVSEGQEAAKICIELGLACFVFDAEVTWDAQSAPDSKAVQLLQAFRTLAPAVKTGWCYWAFWRSKAGVSWAPRKSVIWAATMTPYGECDYVLPMAYWNPGTSAVDAVAYLEESIKQWREVTDKPIVPIGRAYTGDGGTPTPEAVAAFDRRARELGAVGTSWWSMQHAIGLPSVWNVLKALAPFGATLPPAEPPEEPPEETPEETQGLIFSNLTRMNIRLGPSTSAAVVGLLEAGTQVKALEIGGGNCWIRTERGWVCKAMNGVEYLEQTGGKGWA